MNHVHLPTVDYSVWTFSLNIWSGCHTGHWLCVPAGFMCVENYSIVTDWAFSSVFKVLWVNKFKLRSQALPSVPGACQYTLIYASTKYSALVPCFSIGALGWFCVVLRLNGRKCSKRRSKWKPGPIVSVHYMSALRFTSPIGRREPVNCPEIS